LFLEITTLVVLIVTLAIKFVTAKSAQNQQLERTELENEYHKLRQDYNQLFENRKSSEEQAKKLEAEVVEMTEAVEEAKVDLDDQIERNEDLGG
jgi:septal ring factor EnvC (AmiA/AmiB activator)